MDVGYALNIPEVQSGDAAIATRRGEPLILEPGKTYVIVNDRTPKGGGF
jgi:hypothetical protein